MDDLREIERMVSNYSRRIQELKQLDKELQSLNTKGFEEEVEEIKNLLKNPKAVGEIKRKLNELKKRISEREEAEKCIKKVENLIKSYEGKIKIDKGRFLEGEKLFNNKKYKNAKQFLISVKKEIENGIKLYKKYITKEKEFRRIYEEIRSEVIIPEKINKILKEVDEISSRKEYKIAIEKVKKLQTLLTEIKTKAMPKISINFPKTLLTLNRWKKIPIVVKNKGDAHAKNVKLYFSKETEVKGIKSFDLKAGQQKEIEINLKPLEAGEVPIEIKTEYERWDGKKYGTSQILTIYVNEYAKTLEEPKKIKKSQVRLSFFPSELLQYYEEPVLIGQGGFARVFKAKRKRDGKEVAIKVPIAMDKSTGKSFIKELESWTKLKHENIVEIYDYNVLPFPYFEMELCDESLEEVEKPMEVEKAAWIVFNIAEGLKYAHEKGIIHCDLKPKNILLKEGMPKITDWGLSKLIDQSKSPSIQAFSPLYASPEHFSKKFGKKNERTDIWQLGIILYELVTGQLPFEGEDIAELAFKIINENYILSSELNKEAKKVEHIIDKCLQRKKEDRYKSVKELQKDLAKVLNIEYKEQLKKSLQKKNLSRSAYYCGELLLLNMKIGELYDAYKYATDLMKYAEDEAKEKLENLQKELEERIKNNLGIHKKLIEKAKIIVHRVGMGT